MIRFGTRGGSQGEFVSFDARRVPSNARRFEVIKVGPPTLVTTRSSNSAPPVPPGDVRAISPRTTSSTSSEGSLPHGSLPSPQEPREFVTSFGSLPTVTEFTISDAGSMVGDETDSSPPQLTEYESSEFSPEKISVREISPRSPHIVRTPPGLLWPSAGSQHRSTSDISMAASASVSPPPAIIGTSTAAGLVGGGGGGGGRGRSAPNSSVFPGTLSPSGARMFGSNGTTFTPSIASRTATPMRSVSGPGPRSAVVSPLSIVTNAPLDASGRASDSHFAGVEREYRSPPMSFSTPRTDGIPRAMMAGSLQNEMSRRISASVAAAAASDALLAESTQDGLAGAGVTDGVTERASTPLPSPPSNMPPLQSSFSPDSDGHGSQLDLAAAKYELEREHVMRDYEEQLLRHSKDLEDLKRADEHESSIPYDKV